MVWDVLWLGVCGLLVGAAGRLAPPGSRPPPWPRTLLLGLGGALGGGLLTAIVLGWEHAGISLLISVGMAAVLVTGYAAYHRSRDIPPS